MTLLVILALLLFFDLLPLLIYLILFVIVANFLLHSGLLNGLGGYGGYHNYGYHSFGYGNGFYLPIHLDGTTIILLVIIAVLWFRRRRRAAGKGLW